MAYLQKSKRPAIRQKRIEFDGYKFDSMAEMSRYQHLKILAYTGDVNDLEVHPKISLDINGVHICRYHPDFRYKDRYGNTVIEDVKGKWKNQAAFKQTANWQIFSLKARMVKAILGLEIAVIYK